MIDLSTASSSQVMQLLGGKRPTILVGSAISKWWPTNLPMGQDFTGAVLQAIFYPTAGVPIPDPEDQKFLEELLSLLPFEMLLERCPDQSAIGSLLASVYNHGEPNSMHKALAKMAADGNVECLITTNYDIALDTALFRTAAPLTKVVVESDVPRPSGRLYFKAHGSADDPGSLVYSMRLESRLPDWKRRILSRCIDDRPLIIIGYSGLDFEVCPEISHLHPSIIAWNFFTAADMEKPGAKYLTAHGMPLVPLLGDMVRLLELLGYPVPRLRHSTATANVTNIIRGNFRVEELLVWKTRLLNTMGFCRIAGDTLTILLRSGYKGGDIEYAQALFHLGKYRSAGREFLKASERRSDDRERALRLLDASDSFRCFGNLVYAYALVRRAEKLARLKCKIDPFIFSRIAMKKLLLLQDIARFLPMGSHIVSKFGTRLISSGARAALDSGEWLAFQQFKFIAERWAIPTAVFTHAGAYDPPPAKDGYRHLGYKIGELMNLLDRARQAPASISYRELSTAYRAAAQLGNHPTAWKIAARIAISFPRHRRRYRRFHRHHLEQCEYSRIRRWINRTAK